MRVSPPARRNGDRPAFEFHQQKIWVDNLLAGPTALALSLAWLGGSTPFCRYPFHTKLERASSVWILSTVALFGLLGAAGFAKETRYLAPLIPVVAWLFYTRYEAETLHLASRNDGLSPLFLLAMVAGAMLAGYYLLVPQYDEILSPLDLLLLTSARRT